MGAQLLLRPGRCKKPGPSFAALGRGYDHQLRSPVRGVSVQLKWLEDLLALQEAGSIVRAAQRRHVTHPAFGRRLRSLEAWAGTPLIVRDAPTLQFTAAGEAMLDSAREAIAALSRARRSAPGDVAQESVHLVTGRPLARTLLPTWYARMRPIFGGRKLQVSTMVVQD